MFEARRQRRQRKLDGVEIPENDVTVTDELLGKGGFGTVYLADYNGRNAAAKVRGLRVSKTETNQICIISSETLIVRVEAISSQRLATIELVTLLHGRYGCSQTSPQVSDRLCCVVVPSTTSRVYALLLRYNGVIMTMSRPCVLLRSMLARVLGGAGRTRPR